MQQDISQTKPKPSAPLALATASMLSVVTIAFLLGCSSSSDEAAEGDPECVPVSAALRERSADDFTSAPEATDLQVKAAAVFWAAAILARSPEGLERAELLVGLEDVLADVPKDYGALMVGATCNRVVSQALIKSRADFQCSDSCVPHPALFENTVDAMLGAAVTKLDKSVDSAKTVYEAFVALRDSGKSILQTLAGLGRADADALLIASAEALKAAGAVATAVGTAPAVAAAAGVVSAWQLGWEIGSVANLSLECVEWKSDNCACSEESPGPGRAACEYCNRVVLSCPDYTGGSAACRVLGADAYTGVSTDCSAALTAYMTCLSTHDLTAYCAQEISAPGEPVVVKHDIEIEDDAICSTERAERAELCEQ